MWGSKTAARICRLNIIQTARRGMRSRIRRTRGQPASPRRPSTTRLPILAVRCSSTSSMRVPKNSSGGGPRPVRSTRDLPQSNGMRARKPSCTAFCRIFRPTECVWEPLRRPAGNDGPDLDPVLIGEHLVLGHQLVASDHQMRLDDKVQLSQNLLGALRPFDVHGSGWMAELNLHGSYDTAGPSSIANRRRRLTVMYWTTIGS